jgi:NAD(P)-dependent dehydrogenase (short-subunit alcohol dehydrogenase family)
MKIDLSGRVAIVTGAGGGLGRAHALALAQRGAKVVVNDLGDAADAVVEQIRAAGGEAMTSSASVTDFAAVQATVDAALARWGKVDILVNNAGILRDKTFAKMALEEFRLVLEVHLMGSVHFTKAVWDTMRANHYGRIVFTTSSSGLYGNFGQSNYGAAKMALVGLMQTLGLEGERNNIRVNCLAPTAATRMTQGLLSEDLLRELTPERVAPAVVFLASDLAPNRKVLLAGAGSFEACHVTMTQGLHLGAAADVADQLAQAWEHVADSSGAQVPGSALEQGRHEVTLALGPRA